MPDRATKCSYQLSLSETQCYLNVVSKVVQGVGDISKLRNKASLKLKDFHSHSLGMGGGVHRTHHQMTDVGGREAGI